MLKIKEKKDILLKILYVTLAISLITVWGQSCLNKADSTVSSDTVVGIFMHVDEMKNGTQTEFEQYDRAAALVRKAAHVIEYSIVGFQIMCIMYLKNRKSRKDHVIAIYAGLTIALIDETIQIFASRGPLVSDIWIDLGGILIGIGIARLVLVIIRKSEAEKEKELLKVR